MNCRRVSRLTDDYLDGLLSPRRRSRLEAHLRGCTACRETLRETAALRTRLAALPRSFAPPHDLWYAVRGRLSEGATRRPARRHPGLLIPIGAGALALLLIAFFVLPPSNRTPLFRRPGVISAAHPAAGPADFRTVDANYRQARDTLLTALDSGLADVDPQLIELVRTNLEIIDRAVREIESALRKYPEESELLLLLAAANSRRLDILAAAQKQFLDL